jgi:ADP-ribose pyrophosphatase YjhB (NUDIX family)
MLKIPPPAFHFCPFCGQKLHFRLEDGQKRKYCPDCHWTYYPHVAASVAAVIIRGEKILLVQRARAPYQGTWMFPAGFIDFGEHPLETLQREVKEETGLKLKKAKLIEILQSQDDPRSPGHFMFFYQVWAEGKIDNRDSEENQNLGWFEIKNLPPIGWRAHQQIIRKLQRGSLKTARL